MQTEGKTGPEDELRSETLNQRRDDSVSSHGAGPGNLITVIKMIHFQSELQEKHVIYALSYSDVGYVDEANRKRGKCRSLVRFSATEIQEGLRDD